MRRSPLRLSKCPSQRSRRAPRHSDLEKQRHCAMSKAIETPVSGVFSSIGHKRLFFLSSGQYVDMRRSMSAIEDWPETKTTSWPHPASHPGPARLGPDAGPEPDTKASALACRQSPAQPARALPSWLVSSLTCLAQPSRPSWHIQPHPPSSPATSSCLSLRKCSPSGSSDP